VGKVPSELQRADIAAYRDYLIGKRLQRATVAKKVGSIGTLLQAAFDAGSLAQNVARGMRIPKAKVAPVGRRSFNDKELQQVFASPVFSQRKRFVSSGGEAAAWVPILALTTGARLEEICQLRIDDIECHAAHGPLMHITDEGKDQRVKTASSRRIVPLLPWNAHRTPPAV
jgi:integrase